MLDFTTEVCALWAVLLFEEEVNMDRTVSYGWLWLSGILPWLPQTSRFLGAVGLKALEDLWMVAAVPGIGMPGRVFSSQTWSLGQARCTRYCTNCNSEEKTPPHPNGKYGLVLLLNKLGV